MSDLISQFEQRKRDHLNLALDDRNEAFGLTLLDQLQLEHDAWPEIDFSEVDISQPFFGIPMPTPFFVSGMTAGHSDAPAINLALAEACATQGWALGVGSQRRQLDDLMDVDHWNLIRTRFPKLVLLSNIGITQLVGTKIESILSLVEALQSQALVIHFNPLQEVLQLEGTPNFSGSKEALSALSRELLKRKIPLILKETGCGFSEKTLRKFALTLGKSISAIDVSGLGGTHWGRVEGARAGGETKKISDTFANWGISTVDSVVASLEVAQEMSTGWETWASGGVRSGHDAAKLISLGAARIGFAKPALQAAQLGPLGLQTWMKRIERELRVAVFCTGNRNLNDLAMKQVNA